LSEPKSKFKSAKCSFGNCVEVCCLGPDAFHMRDSKNRGQAALVFSDAEWRAFVAGVKHGDFDLPRLAAVA
jgi:hypothetical protein